MATPFTYTSAAEDHIVTPDFATSALTICALVDRVKTRIRYLSAYGCAVKGVKVTDAKESAREIRGMISLLNAVCDSPTLQAELLNEMQDALNTALARLRK